MDSISQSYIFEYACNKPCYTCGINPRYPGRSQCRECYAAWRKAYRKRKYNPEKQRNRNLKSHFNITQEEYDLMLFQQCGVCAICGKPETAKSSNGTLAPLSVDHDHQTGAIRGLLCRSCNTFLGKLEAHEERIKYFKKYLKKYQKQGLEEVP